MKHKILAYSYKGTVNAIEINEDDIETFINENEAELDNDINGDAAYSIYSARVNNTETAKMLFTNTYIAERETVEIES